MNPAGYHLVNILLHAANAALFDAVARRLLAAALPDTALTPRRLGPRPPRSCSRSIRCAWIRSPGVTERRDVLAALFYLLTVLAWLRSATPAGHERRRWY